MSETVIRSITPAISIFSVPFKRFGLMKIGGRSTAVKLANNDIFIIPSSPLGEDVKAEIARLGGQVKYLVAPDFEHTMFTKVYSKEYPSALCIGPEGVDTKIPEVKWAGTYKTNGLAGADEKFGYEDEIETCYFKSHANKDIAFLHKPSKTLIEADLLFNLPCPEQGIPAGGLFGFMNISPGGAAHRGVVSMVSSADKKLYGQSAAIVAGWDFDRIIPCHGAVIETGGKEAWVSTNKNVIDAASA
ncbi:Protein of unknown function DUF4336 [Phaffia rhodozyma]|uniref:Uncharacterized protein n=1 Tax=Phaffia rhodozyma TaxID=264483 RepID=A0A0F7SM82_PHARH|nr:Protein of unknown function DUF4336 [Phaffia rhodozyma]